MLTQYLKYYIPVSGGSPPYPLPYQPRYNISNQRRCIQSQRLTELTERRAVLHNETQGPNESYARALEAINAQDTNLPASRTHG
jgi:hypothetical protein